MNAAAIDKLVIEMSAGSQIVLAITLAMMMFSVALGLRPSHFAFFKTDPKHYIAGVAAQIIGLPLLTLILVYLVQPAPSLALGMILIACCPGGNVSNLLALFARANTALSVSMTATSSLAAAFVTPISIVFWASLYGPTNNLLTEINFNAAKFLTQTLLILGVPIFLGMFVVWKWSAMAARLQKPLALVSGIVLLIIIITSFYGFRDILVAVGMVIIPLVALHNAAAFMLGYFTGWATRADIPTRRALTFEIGIQNSGLGFVILVTQLSGLGGAAAVAGLWGLWHIFGGLVMIGLFRAADRKRELVNV